jgi:hypothetical protein
MTPCLRAVALVEKKWQTGRDSQCRSAKAMELVE